MLTRALYLHITANIIGTAVNAELHKNHKNYEATTSFLSKCYLQKTQQILSGTRPDVGTHEQAGWKRLHIWPDAELLSLH